MTTTSAGTLTVQQLDQAFAQPIEPVRVTPVYRLGLLVVALAMILLPLIYLALIGAVGFGLYYHAVHSVAIFETNGSSKGKVLAYVTPLIVGAFLLLFMIKPLFAPRGKEPERKVLDPEQQPMLFAFVERICRAVGAPVPRQIDVDCQVNASARFRRGLFSMLGNDLALTIGLPLVRGMPLRHLAGVLAHEFGHFSQGAGMRLTYIIRSINHWFSRVVYERDAWDQRLTSWSKGGDLRLMIILNIARLFIWLTRRMLWALMMAGHAISCFALRQMEYDADRYEARLAGSRTFGQTVLYLHRLGAASWGAYQTLGQSLREGRLVDDFPAFLDRHADRLSDETNDAILEGIEQSRTGIWDTHPADPDRIDSASREQADGVFTLDLPATAVFSRFDALSRDATLHYYRSAVGPEITGQNLVSGDELFAQEEAIAAADRARENYFDGYANSLQPLAVNRNTAMPADADTLAETLGTYRRQMIEGLPAAKAALARSEETYEKSLTALQAKSLLFAKFPIHAKDFGLPKAKVEAADEVHATQQAAFGASIPALADFNKLVSLRMGAGLAMLRFRAPDQAGEADRLANTLDVLASQFEQVTAIRTAYSRLATLANMVDNDGPDKDTRKTMVAHINEILPCLHELHRVLEAVPYPFAHAREGATLADQIVPKLPQPEDHGDIYHASQEVMNQFYPLYYRVLGSLTALLEPMEA